jgi:hypothetical protein
LEGLPAADELRRIPVVKPESLVTADPGLATVPPDQLQLSQVESAPAKPETDLPSHEHSRAPQGD